MLFSQLLVAGPPGNRGARAQELVASDHRHEQERAATLFLETEEPAAQVQTLILEDVVLIIAQVGEKRPGHIRLSSNALLTFFKIDGRQLDLFPSAKTGV